MKRDEKWLWILALAAAGTWLERVGPWILMTRLSSYLENYSKYSEIWVENFVPAIVMILLIRAVTVSHHLGMIFWGQVAGASVLTIGVAKMTNSLALSVLSGMVSYWAASFIR